MGAVLVGGELGLHHRVADLAAELRRVHVLDARVGSQRHDQDVGDREREKITTARRWTGSSKSIDGHCQAPCRRRPLAALEPDADRNEHEARHEEHGKIRKNRRPMLRIAVEAENLEQEEGDEQQRAGRGQRRAEDRDTVAKREKRPEIHSCHPPPGARTVQFKNANRISPTISRPRTTAIVPTVRPSAVDPAWRRLAGEVVDRPLARQAREFVLPLLFHFLAR